MTSLCGLHTIGKSLYHLSKTGYNILFIHLNDLCLGLLLVAAVHLCHYGLGEVEECLAGDGLGMACCRLTLVAVLTDALHERNLGEQWDMQFVGKLLAAFLAEDIILVFGQFGRREPCHVLHHTEDGHVHLVVLIHVDTLARIGESHTLRCAHDYGTRNGECLQERQMDIARTWRSVEDEIVQVAPVGVGDELLQCVGRHSAAPQGGSV